MSKLLFDGIFKFIETYFNGLGSSMKNLDILFYVFVGLELLFVIYFLVKSHFAYQFRLIRAIDKINIYLLNNSYINENNLIEFNKKMKKVPKVLRYHWQQYMLYREQSPSFYMSSNNVIEKPLRSSSVKYNIKTMKALTIIFTTLSILLSAAVLGLSQTQTSFIAPIIFRILIIPSMTIFIGCVYGIYQNARQSANLSDLYQTFHIFQRLIDKAVTTMPEYVDFEVLFTKKEIAKGIPALNEYLEKRARQEQEELEKARRNAVDHEVYDFGSVDISGSLILDRAMKETEIYLSLRNRLLAEIQQVESQIDTLKKSYDNTQREIQRKMQTAKENIERIRMQQESSTNRIEGNYLKKQQDQEISKLTQLEKDNTEETYRFNQELEVLTSEIDKKKAELEEYLHMMEEAKKRDHRKLGKELGLFMMCEEGPGFPFFLPKGMVLKNTLLDYWREIHQKAGYVEISTPIMLARHLWETSGHWDHYKENMYTTVIDDQDFAIKPMNCPGGILVYQSEPRSYRDLPLRMGELGLVHRHEKSGQLHGLMRVRCFTQDDAHIFMMPEQIREEIKGVAKLIDEVYQLFGFKYHVELSTRPEDSMGSDEDWEMATDALRGALDDLGLNYVVNEGDGAFYGPKIDFHLEDSIGRTWQCGTIQLDFQLPLRFNCEYVGADGEKHRPIMIHRVAFGSIERFIGILIEHFAGAFPTWLAPVQVKVLPISDKYADYGKKVLDALHEAGIRAEMDTRSEKIGYKIREAQGQKIPYMLIAGAKEEEAGLVSVRSRFAGDEGQRSLEQFIADIKEEIASRVNRPVTVETKENK